MFITLDRLEHMTLANTSSLNIKIFKHYVDDCFVLIDKQTDSKKLLNAFNAAHPSIKFEMENKSDDIA